MDEAGRGVQDDYESLFEDTAVGNLIVEPNGVIQQANRRFATWMATRADQLTGRPLLDLLTVGGKIYLETHLLPTLRMQGEFEEVMLEMKKSDGGRLPVLVNAFERRDPAGRPLFLRFTIVRAASRLTYEQNLREATRQAKEALASAEGTLLDERQTAVLREQFVAVLGHDLRNPLAAIDAGVRTLGRSPLDDRQSRIAVLVQAAVRRMGGLIDDIMDLARGRLGGGIPVRMVETELAPVLQQVADELVNAHPDRRIEADLQLTSAVRCDGPRIAQLASNLLANAITHGANDGPVRLVARTTPGGFELSVENRGEPIPEEAIGRLFQPFARAAGDGTPGLGLGLYIVSEIAKSHGGSLDVHSTAEMTIFTVRIPQVAAP